MKTVFSGFVPISARNANGLQDRIVAAAGTPAHLLAGGEIGGRKVWGSDIHGFILLRQGLSDRRFDFGDTEGLAGNLAERLGVDEILVAQNRLELASVHFGNQDLLIAAEQRSQVAGQRPQMADVDVAYIARRLRAARCTRLLDGAERRAPANDGKLAAGCANVTSCSGMKLAMPSILAFRVSVIF